MASRRKKDAKGEQSLFSLVDVAKSQTSNDTGNKHIKVTHPHLFTCRLD